MNNKTKRLLEAIACLCATENVSPSFITRLDKIVQDKRDGYTYDFKGICKECIRLLNCDKSRLSHL